MQELTGKKEMYKLDVPNFNHNFFFIYVTIVMTGESICYFCRNWQQKTL